MIRSISRAGHAAFAIVVCGLITKWGRLESMLTRILVQLFAHKSDPNDA